MSTPKIVKYSAGTPTIATSPIAIAWITVSRVLPCSGLSFCRMSRKTSITPSAPAGIRLRQ